MSQGGLASCVWVCMWVVMAVMHNLYSALLWLYRFT